MPLVLSLTLGAGLLLVYLSATAGRRVEAEGRTSPDASGRFEEFLLQAGVEGVSARHFLLLSAAAGVATGLASQVALGWPVVSLAMFAVGLVLPIWYFRNRADRRRADLQAALADAVDALRAGVRTGMSIEEGIAGLAHNGPEILRPALAELTRDLRLEAGSGRRVVESIYEVTGLEGDALAGSELFALAGATLRWTGIRPRCAERLDGRFAWGSVNGARAPIE